MLLLILLAAVLFWPILRGDQTLYFGDLSLQFIPQLAFQRSELLAGRIPLWNPLLLCGTPFVGNPQAWPLYPSSLLLYALPAERAVGVIGAGHAALAAVGTLLFLRQRGRGVGASLLGALAWGFGAAVVSKFQFPNMAQAAAFFPWLLWGIDRVVERPKIVRIVLLALLVGLALLAAHTQIFLMQFYLGAAWTLWRARERGREGQRSVAAVAAGLVLGALLAAAYLLPTLDLVRASVRAGLSLDHANRFYLPPRDLLAVFLLPNLRGNPATGDFHVPGNFWERAAYLGVLPFALGVWAGVTHFRRAPEVRFWALAALGSLWLAVGKVGGLFVLAYWALPGLSKFHDPARFLLPATFALIVLAAAGWDALAARTRPSVYRFAAPFVLGLAALDLGAFVRTLNPTVEAGVWATIRPSTPPLLRGRRVYHADESLAWRRFVSYRSYLPGDAAHVRAFLRALGPNLPALQGGLNVNGYDPVHRVNIDALLFRLRQQVKQQGARAPLLEATATTFLLRLDPRTPARIDSARATVLPGAKAGRAQLWTTWRGAPTATAALAQVLAPAWDGVPVLVGPPARAAAAAAQAAPLVIVEELPDRVVVAIPANAPPAALVTLADTWHPGWRAFVDGAPAVLVLVNGVFRGVRLEKRNQGAHRVELRYTPTAWKVGLYASLCAVGTLSAMCSFAAVTMMRPRAGAPNKQTAEKDG